VGALGKPEGKAHEMGVSHHRTSQPLTGKGSNGKGCQPE